MLFGLSVWTSLYTRALASVAYYLDLLNDRYKADNGANTFASAITHARNGNAVMTDGYGPELVTNGGFDSDSDWTLSNMDIEDGVLEFDTSQTTGTATQTLSMETGKTYVLRFYIANRTQGNLYPRLGSFSNLDTLNSDANGWHEYIVNFDGTSNQIQLVTNVSFNGYIDNVSVREMPVLKWAPHNQFPESEDVSGWTLTGLTPTTNAITAPDGTTTADLLTVTNGASSTIATNVTDTGDVFALWVKNNGADFLSVYFSGYSGRAWVDLSDFTAGSATGNISIKGITSAGDGWYLIEFQKQDNSSRAPVITLTDANNGGTVTGDGVKGIYVWGAHLYRSDLGGMVDNPDRGDSYVPTTSSAVYLPRRNHHIYNGDAWVNEGLLHESEARTNLYPDSSLASVAVNNVTISTSAGGPIGSYKEATSNTATSQKLISLNQITMPTSTDVRQSVFLKYVDWQWVQIDTNATASRFFNFDLINGVVGTTSNISDINVEDYGDGWWRLSWVINVASSNQSPTIDFAGASDSTRRPTTTTAGQKFLVAGFQAEQVSKQASSYIPTSGATVTRAAETLTIPSANLPWPTPKVIGSELVTNSDYSNGSTGWTITIDNGWDFSGGSAAHSGATGGRLRQPITCVVGKVYEFKFDLDATGDTSFGNTSVAIRNSADNNSIIIFLASDLTAGANKSYSATFVATETTHNVAFYSEDNVALDNVSVKEIDPLALSIQMKGRATYVDDNQIGTVALWSWTNGPNYLRAYIRTDGTKTGMPYVQQNSAGTLDVVNVSDAEEKTPGVFVPFNIATRHGNTFVNAASDGVAQLADTTPTGLPDIENYNLDLGNGFMGTIESFQIWDRDIGDTGIVAESSPDLEPSLSLVFDSSFNSFVVKDWSE